MRLLILTRSYACMYRLLIKGKNLEEEDREKWVELGVHPQLIMIILI